VTTTSTSNGSVNAMHDSLNPLTGLFPMIGMWLNVEFGGVGVGLINMFVFIILSVFIAGLMVGRTPEYLTRKSRRKRSSWPPSRFWHTRCSSSGAQPSSPARPGAEHDSQSRQSRPERDSL